MSLGSFFFFFFLIYGNTLTLTLTQNWGNLPWVSWGKTHILESKASHHSQIKIEARDIWPIEVRLHKVKYCFGIEFGSSTFWWFRFGFGIFLGSNFGNKLLCFLYMFWIFNSKKETTKIIHHRTLSHGTHFYFNFHVYVLFFIYNFYI